MKILRTIAGATVIAILAGTLSGCLVESRPRWQPAVWHRHAVIVVR